MQPIRQGDVLLIPCQVPIELNQRLPHLILAEGEVTGHKHQITRGDAKLYQKDGTLYLRVLSERATLSHEQHRPLEIAQGDWTVRIQREYEPQAWRYVTD